MFQGGLARVWLAASVLALAVAPAVGGIREAVVFQGGQEYDTYRIPTVVKAANGDVLAFAEARASGSDTTETDIVMRRSTDDGRTWQPLQVVKNSVDFTSLFPAGSVPPITVGNQTPVVDLLDPEYPGRIWMPFTLENDRVFVTYSDDHGASWSPHVEVTSTVKQANWGWYATGPVHGIQLTRGANAGRLIIPSDHRRSDITAWGSHVMYSDDHGLTWQLGAIDTRSNGEPVFPNENVATELVDGRVYFNARDQQGSSAENRAIAYSSDGGITYDAPFVADGQFVTPVVQNSVLRFAATDEGDPQNILIYSGPGQANSRSDLTIRVSLDEGTTWLAPTVVHPGPAAYSDLVKLSDEQIGVLFEAGPTLYSQIVFGYFDYADLNPAPFNGLNGDVDQNGVLEPQDLNLFVSRWRDRGQAFFFGGQDSYTNGDLNFDGAVDLYDALLMRQHFTATGLETAALEIAVRGVPEPSSLVMSAIAILTWLRSRS